MIGKQYVIEFKSSAELDLDALEKFLIKDCSAPLTAKRKFEDFDNRLSWLEKFAELPAIDFNLSYRYNALIRTIPLGKKMAIVYSVEDDVVYILRVMPQSMIF